MQVHVSITCLIVVYTYAAAMSMAYCLMKLISDVLFMLSVECMQILWTSILLYVFCMQMKTFDAHWKMS